MAWYRQLDNSGKETDVVRFFTDNQVKALDEIQKKTKRKRWVLTTEPNQQKQVEVKMEKPTRTVTLMEVNEAETEEKLNLLFCQTENLRIKKAITEKIKSLTNKQN